MRTLAAMIALLAACGDNLAGPIAIADFSVAVREAVCQRLVRCGEIESLEVCHATNIGLTIAFTASDLAAVDLGKVRYSGAAARSCIDGYASASCDRTSRSATTVPEACAAVLTGALPDGEACAFGQECRSLRCDVPRCNLACCTGHCVGDTPPPPAQLGESCGQIACAADLRCNAAELCVSPHPRGAACAADDDCDYDLICDQHQCAIPPTLGQACTSACRDEGTTCSSASRTCVEVGLAGAPCSITSRSSDCSPVYFCDRSSHCSAGIALGQPCSLGDRCADVRASCNAQLDGTPGVCALPRPDGARCTRNAGCDSLYCDPFTLRCAPQPVCL
jgi:hypothetical protein